MLEITELEIIRFVRLRITRLIWLGVKRFKVDMVGDKKVDFVFQSFFLLF